MKGALVQILDPQEEAFPFDGRTIFESVGGTLRHETLKAGDLRDRYLERLSERKARLAAAGPHDRLAAHAPSHRRAARRGAALALRRDGAGALMWAIGPVGFTAPLLLLALLALPVLWLILRAVPPAPIRRRFPGVALLLGLTDDETQTDRTPWWLLLLRMLAVAAVIVGFAGPVLNPQDQARGSGPLLVVLDGTWADARDWPRRMERVDALLARAAREERVAAVVTLTDLPPGAVPFQAADAWAARLPGLRPQPWAPDAELTLAWAGDLPSAETYWLSDGVARPWRAALLEAFEAAGPVTVFESPRPVMGLTPPRYEDGLVAVRALRAGAGPAVTADLIAHGPDPNGVARELARAEISFAEGATEAEARLSLPPELRNRVTRFQLSGLRSAAAVTLSDDALRRREVALIAATGDREGLELLSPTHYLEQALAPTADLIGGAMSDVLLANPDVIVLADVATVDGRRRSARLGRGRGPAGAVRGAAAGGVRGRTVRGRPASAGAASRRGAECGRRHELGRAQGAEPVRARVSVRRSGRSPRTCG